jgi:hypothetical protein
MAPDLMDFKKVHFLMRLVYAFVLDNLAVKNVCVGFSFLYL